MTTPVVTLTFDNGPTPGVTEPVLELLATHAVPATFFAIGRKLATAEGQDLGRRILSEGHRLGGHTWSHSVQFGGADDAVVVDELANSRLAVESAGGEGLLFRPYGAGGVIDERLMSRFGATTLCSSRYTCVLWNVLPGDWRDPDGWVEQALAGIVVHRWSVVVLHDVADAALARLDDFLTAAQRHRPSWSQGFPDECTPIRDGTPTTSFGTLCLDG
jgi:peptidoglycan/xylan/chitin deacetylase (PgdA/CDA1 family)